MELHKQVAYCFTDAILEWRQDEIKRINSLESEVAKVFAHIQLEKIDNALMDITKRVGDKFEALPR